jgi:NADH:ubiquinone oxidoreductase subunit F (NADH-binding)
MTIGTAKNWIMGAGAAVALGLAPPALAQPVSVERIEVMRPGVYETPFGMPLRHLIYDLAGGLAEGRTIQGVLTGGAAGTFLTSEHLDVPSFEDFRGRYDLCGTVMVFDDTSTSRRPARTRCSSRESRGKRPVPDGYAAAG